MTKQTNEMLDIRVERLEKDVELLKNRLPMWAVTTITVLSNLVTALSLIIVSA